jgi:hypothetical protein
MFVRACKGEDLVAMPARGLPFEFERFYYLESSPEQYSGRVPFAGSAAAEGSGLRTH